MTVKYYNERTRAAKREFTLDQSKLSIVGNLHALRYSREFILSELSPASQNIVQIRFDVVRRCCFLAAMNFGFAVLAVKISFPYFWVVALIFGLVSCRLLWSGYIWLRQKEEA